MCDVLILLTTFLPTLTTILHHRWVLGPEICYFVSFTSSVFFFYEILLTVLLSARRLGLISEVARRNGKMSYRVTMFVLAGMFVLAAAPSLCYMALGCGVFFAPHTLLCISSNYRDYPLPSLVVVGVYLVAPVTLLILLNLGILLVLCRASAGKGFSRTIVSLIRCRANTASAGKGFSRTIVSLMVVSWLFTLSYIPIFVKLALGISGYPVSYTFQITQQYLLSANVLLNPVIYLVFNRRLQRFTRDLLGGPVSYISRTVSQSNQ